MFCRTVPAHSLYLRIGSGSRPRPLAGVLTLAATKQSLGLATATPFECQLYEVQRP